jgi:hypothetical protein
MPWSKSIMALQKPQGTDFPSAVRTLAVCPFAEADSVGNTGLTSAGLPLPLFQMATFDMPVRMRRLPGY